MSDTSTRRHRRPLLRAGRRRPQLPAEGDLDNKELVEVIERLGWPIEMKHLGLKHLVGYWKIDRRLVEVVFDEVGRASRVAIT